MKWIFISLFLATAITAYIRPPGRSAIPDPYYDREGYERSRESAKTRYFLDRGGNPEDVREIRDRGRSSENESLSDRIKRESDVRQRSSELKRDHIQRESQRRF